VDLEVHIFNDTEASTNILIRIGLLYNMKTSDNAALIANKRRALEG
jgi:hypothetical protein